MQIKEIITNYIDIPNNIIDEYIESNPENVSINNLIDFVNYSYWLSDFILDTDIEYSGDELELDEYFTSND